MCATVPAVALAAAVVDGCAGRPPALAGPGVVPCRSGRVANFMAAEAQRCWYVAGDGRWRITNHEFHYDVLVVETEATSPDLTAEIVRRLAEVHGERFIEILVYVKPDPGVGGTTVRRARWTRSGPLEQFDFPAW
jgi:hypothetical protein